MHSKADEVVAGRDNDSKAAVATESSLVPPAGALLSPTKNPKPLLATLPPSSSGIAAGISLGSAVTIGCFGKLGVDPRRGGRAIVGCNFHQVLKGWSISN